MNLLNVMLAGFRELGVDIYEDNGEIVAKKRTKKPRAAKNTEFSEVFRQVVELYPKRKPTPNWMDAYAAWEARISEGEDVEVMRAGVERYAACVRAQGKEGTEYILLPATFFGPRKHYLLPHDPPIKPKSKEEREKLYKAARQEPRYKLPETQSVKELAHWARAHDYPLPEGIKTLDDLSTYKRRILDIINQRLVREVK